MPIDPESPLCPYCGYCIEGLPSDICPECGKPCPEPFRPLPAGALLPWERSIQSREIVRFLRTIAYACTHYIRYLRALRERGPEPVYKARRLVVWFALAALLLPFVIDTLDKFVGPPVHRFPVTLWPKLWFIVERAGLGPLLCVVTEEAALGIACCCKILLVGAFIHGACRLSRQTAPFHLCACAIAPPTLAIQAAWHLLILTAVHVERAWRGLMGAAESFAHSLDIAQALVLALCAALALRIVWRWRPRTVVLAAAVVGLIAYYAPLLEMRAWIPLEEWLLDNPSLRWV